MKWSTDKAVIQWDSWGHTGSYSCLSLHLKSVLLAVCKSSWWPSPGIYRCTSHRAQRNKEDEEKGEFGWTANLAASLCQYMSLQISHSVRAMHDSWSRAPASWGYWVMLYLHLTNNCVHSCMTVITSSTREKESWEITFQPCLVDTVQNHPWEQGRPLVSFPSQNSSMQCNCLSPFLHIGGSQ